MHCYIFAAVCCPLQSIDS